MTRQEKIAKADAERRKAVAEATDD